MLDALMTLLRALRDPSKPSKVNRELTKRQDAVEARLERLRTISPESARRARDLVRRA